jgi:nitrite reductase/ring-hydroxylating ferredoxin subunit
VTNPELTISKRLCALADIVDAGAIEVEATVDDVTESLIVLRRGDEARAFLNVCPHAGRRLDWAPGRFLFDQGFLVCAAHGACFSVPDGLCVSGPCRGQSLSSVDVVVCNGDVQLI